MNTPWGASDYREQTPVPGVTFYGTPSHGGYHVTGPALDRIPAQFRESKYTPGYPGWFEEDCDWAIVAVFIPEAFPVPPHDGCTDGYRHVSPIDRRPSVLPCDLCAPQDLARLTLERYRPEVLAYRAGLVVLASDSATMTGPIPRSEGAAM